jgi:cell division protease FtsH
LNQIKGFGFYVFLIVVLLGFAFLVFGRGTPAVAMTYSSFVTELGKDNVQSVELTGNKMSVVLNTQLPNTSANKYSVVVPPMNDPTTLLLPSIQAGKVTMNVVIPQSFDAIFNWLSIIMILGVVVVIFIFYRQYSQGGGGAGKAMQFGKSRAKLAVDGKIKVTFADVAGLEEVKEELEEIVEFLKAPKKFIDIGARIPKGVLLVGPPGTGKTYLAKAVSGEAGVPFYSISGSDFVEMFVGVGASRVRDLFDQAKKTAPCIVFIDEIDAVGRHRGAGLGGGHDEREQTLNQLLVEMDGFGLNEGVIILAATNRPDILDPALLRPGRFDRRIAVGMPDIKGREEILKVHSRGKPLGEDVRLEEIAKITSGFTGADLENLLNESAILAARKNKKFVSMDDMRQAIFKVTIGPEKKSSVMNEEEKKLTAFHEAGHAIAVRLVSTTDKVNRVSIIPAGDAGGYTSFRPDEDKHYRTKQQLLDMILIMLAGRAADEIIFGEIDTGAASDLQNVNLIARSMVTKYGMSEKIGNMVFTAESDEIFIGRDYGHMKSYSENLASQIDEEVKSIIESCYTSIKGIIKKNINTLNMVAHALLEKERLEGEEFEAIFINSQSVAEA